MSQGVRSTDQWREHRALLEAISRNREEAAAIAAGAEPQREAPPAAISAAPAPPPPAPLELGDVLENSIPWRDIFLGVVLLLIAALWIAAVGATIAAGDSPLVSFTALVSLASGPLALLGVIFIVIQRTSRREAKRFAGMATAMRAEAHHLEQVVGTLSDRIGANRQALADHAQQLLLLGEDSTTRLSEISAQMQRETRALRVEADHLERAADTARTDLSVLIDDMPRVEQQVRAIAAGLKDGGAEAESRVAALEGQLDALARQGERAETIADNAARALGQQIDKIESGSALAGRHIDEAARHMADVVESALAKAADAVDSTRQGLETQGAAMLAMVEQSAAALDRSGGDATDALAARVAELGRRIDSLSGRLAQQDQASQTLLDGIDRSLDDIEARFAELGTKGGAATSALAEALSNLRQQSDGMTDRLAAAAPAAEALVDRAAALKAALDASTAGIDDHIPAALVAIEAQAQRSHAAIAAIVPESAALQKAAGAVAADLTASEGAVAQHRAAIEAMHDAAGDRLAEVQRQAEALQTVIADADAMARQLADRAGPQLVEALLRVKDTAAQAAERARDSIGAIIPQAADALGQAAREALERAVAGELEARLAEVGRAAEAAIASSVSANDRLERQLLSIRDTAAAVDARIDEVQAQIREADEEGFSRRVALLVESLNSTAIDVAKILSNDVTDSAWTSYLKGDRSVFTRRAVRLVDAAEAKEIARHYEEEAEFRDQVNRYIHDFEAMLRRVLASRDGAPLSVTLLSSDMGKLYVALAQAIDRLRT